MRRASKETREINAFANKTLAAFNPVNLDDRGLLVVKKNSNSVVATDNNLIPNKTKRTY
jgi:hypothetical protein